MTETRRAAMRRTTFSHAPHLQGPWGGQRITVLLLAALAAPLAITLAERGTAMLPGIALAVVIALGWQALFARLRRRALGFDGIVAALIFTLMLSPATPLWQQGLALSFGIVLGEQVFGGRGRNFLSPAVVALAFLLFSFPGDAPPQAGTAFAVAALAGGALLVFAGLLSWRVVAGVALGLAAVTLLTGGLPDWKAALSGSLVFGIVFLAGDPVAAASTNPGRWIYGLLVGALVVVLGHAGSGAGSVHAVVFAALLGGIFAPLIDRAVVEMNIRRRRVRHG
ncbi:RnfABCDGE type electron transport complex subunit D [Phaeovulum sp.]|uniref:RnfABCDGE type electron transport complex subunit D n=1 Tax=Phaeovulum sp. TaxID=2934796 RepID=UPI00272FBE4E|nr:RnfABCDGE type electron transport complex subunit D [Phaeovulum sp.]MDP1667845.1 RnfABCDGE type electron transport complex subunit D [Phaeovulum sp.]MDZ4120422.1 RnfABCDGE type electron transport complex subunit D [Phaeovulum sp.]